MRGAAFDAAGRLAGTYLDGPEWGDSFLVPCPCGEVAMIEGSTCISSDDADAEYRSWDRAILWCRCPRTPVALALAIGFPVQLLDPTEIALSREGVRFSDPSYEERDAARREAQWHHPDPQSNDSSTL